MWKTLAECAPQGRRAEISLIAWKRNTASERIKNGFARSRIDHDGAGCLMCAKMKCLAVWTQAHALGVPSLLPTQKLTAPPCRP
jgi:hypothetical protein